MSQKTKMLVSSDMIGVVGARDTTNRGRDLFAYLVRLKND
jgi:hypothetical protein